MYLRQTPEVLCAVNKAELEAGLNAIAYCLPSKHFLVPPGGSQYIPMPGEK